MGLANVLAAIDAGVDRFDASIGGIGGCPYAPGATGNVCSEDIVHALALMGFDTGVDLERLVAAARRLPALDRPRRAEPDRCKAGRRLDCIPAADYDAIRERALTRGTEHRPFKPRLGRSNEPHRRLPRRSPSCIVHRAGSGSGCSDAAAQAAGYPNHVSR